MKKYILSILALAAIAFVGCEKDDIDDAGGKQISGQVINFGAGALESRTIYESTDSKQIHWQTGDKVRIYCAQAIGGVTNVENSGDAVAYADYAVTVNATDKSFATIALAEGSSPLLWGGSGIAHKFYAVYPHDAAVDVSDDGVVTFPINRNQICYIQTAAEKAADADASKYTYVARPDMSNAYMVASSEANPVDYVSNGTNHDNVWLDFKPIMTTINIVVKGPQNLTAEGEPDENSTATPVVMTGVSVISTITTNTTASKSQFVYDIEKAMITGSQTGTGTASEQTETTFISPRNSDGLDAVTLKQGETLCLTAFLPPMAETTAEALNRDIKIRVHTTGGNKTMSLEDATVLTPSAKGAIKLPSIYTPISGSNWITPLDGQILMSQLSIPGTHDAGAFDEVGVEINLGLWKPTVTIGKTQDLSIAAQWQMGIRAFDLRSAVYSSTGELEIYHGVARCNGLTLRSILDMIKEQLTKNPKELAIVINRHENDEVLGATFGKNIDAATWQAAMSNLLKEYDDILVEYKKNLTVDDCRGKILFMNRDFYSTSEYTPKGVRIGFDQGWNHNETGGSGTMVPMRGGEGETLYVQDFYETINKESTKLGIIFDYLDDAALTDNEDVTPAWYINHTSGYNSGIEIFGYTIAGLSTTEGYRGNAQYNNPEVYKYLIGTGANSDGKYRTEYGPTGIVIMDFVGARTSGNYTVYGDVLPQAIIDNNYKYRMKRKGE